MCNHVHAWDGVGWGGGGVIMSMYRRGWGVIMFMYRRMCVCVWGGGGGGGVIMFIHKCVSSLNNNGKN